MALDCTAHLRSWIISEVENQLEAAGERTQRWAADLVTALLAPLALPELFIAAAEILTSILFEKFLLFSVRNYPSESAAALSAIIAGHAHIQQ